MQDSGINVFHAFTYRTDCSGNHQSGKNDTDESQQNPRVAQPNLQKAKWPKLDSTPKFLTAKTIPFFLPSLIFQRYLLNTV
jgi:hypothetical protein